MTLPELSSVAFGLLSAATWGAGDFSGGLASKRLSVYAVVIGSQIVGLAMMLGLALAFSEPALTLSEWFWGGAAGIAGAIGILALYRGLAGGRMGLIAPVSAVLAAALPVLLGVLLEGWPRPPQMAGFSLAFVGVWLLSRPEAGANTLRWSDLALPLVAGVGFGLFFVLIDQASVRAVFWPIVAARASSLVLMVIVARLIREPPLPGRQHLPLVMLAGVLDTAGNGFFALAARAGRLDVASVLSSLYPASTVVLAWLILKERLTGWQLVGVAATLAAIVLITI